MRPSNKSLARCLAAGSAALLFGACAARGPNYQAPQTVAGTAFKNASPADIPAIPAGPAWWSLFGDPELERLEKAARSENPGLALVAARVAEARARLGISAAERQASLTLGSSVRVAGESSERVVPIPGHPVMYRDRGDSYRLAFDAGYEIDLWGRVRRNVESAGAQLAASEADERAARLALEADLAAAFLGLRALRAETVIVVRTLESRRAAVGLISTRVEAGYATELDLQRARAECASVEAEVAELGRRDLQYQNALAVLCGSLPSDFLVQAADTAFAPPPAIPAGLPAAMLARRPDIAAAEALLHARTAEIGVAEAARYPAIRLTGSAGFESNELGELLKRPAQFWNLGPSLSLPLLDGGRTKANVEAAKARAEAARADHRQKTLQALREVEDALVDLRQQAEQASALEQARAASAQALQLAQLRYDKGLVTYLEVLDAQRSLLQYERSLAQLAGARQLSTVRLIRALGGSWSS